MDLTKAAAIVGGGLIRIQSEFHKLLFSITFATNNPDTALAALYAATIEGERTHGATYGTDKFLTKQSLGDLMEMAAFFTGDIVITTTGGSTLIEGSVQFTPTGHIKPLMHEYYDFQIAGLPNDSSAKVYSLYPFDKSNQMYQYKQLAILANNETPVNIASAKYLALPVDKFVEIELQYPDNNKRKLLPAELRRVCQELNAASVLKNGSVVAGSNKFYVVPVESAFTALITQNAQGNIYVVHQIGI